MASGSEEIVTFQVTTDSDVTTLWNGGGSWAYEVTYEVLIIMEMLPGQEPKM
jgi:hypothetical protein